MRSVPSPLEPAPPSLGGGRSLFLKREDVHELGAFKWRGALPVLTAYRDGGATTAITASTGNHGAATAWAAERLGLQAVVYAPEGAAQAKLDLIRGLGAEIRLVGADLDAAKEAAREHATRDALPFFEDGAETAQYEGYGAIADEIVDQLDAAPAAVVVPVGNGALLGGIGLRLTAGAPETLRIGVAAKEAPVMAESWHAGSAVTSERSKTFADGLAVRVAIPLAVDVLGKVASRMLLVSEREMAHAVGAYARAGIRVEGAAGAALAALPQLADVDGVIVLIVTGRNIDDELHERACAHPESFPD
jgi:threonine dehydratase